MFNDSLQIKKPITAQYTFAVAADAGIENPNMVQALYQFLNLPGKTPSEQAEALFEIQLALISELASIKRKAA